MKMILRQFCARHGRTVLSQSSRNSQRLYATNISQDDPSIRPSERDDNSTRPIQGHPDHPSSILDTSPSPSTGRTRSLLKEMEAWDNTTKGVHGEINAHIAAKIGGIASIDTATGNPSISGGGQPESTSKLPTIRNPPPKTSTIPFKDLKQYNTFRNKTKNKSRIGTHVIQSYDPSNLLLNPPTATDLTLPMLLANQTHLGHHTSLWNPSNSSYIFGVRDGIHIISLDLTYAYLQRAAKVVQEVARRGGIILFVGTRKNQENIVVRSARRANGYHIFDRWVPGSLTNGQQILGRCAIKVVDIHDNEVTSYRQSLAQSSHPVLKPDLVVCLNPIENEVCLHECGLHTVPTIGVIDTDANPSWVTYPIPANDDSLRSIALIAGVLGRAGEEGQRLRKLEASTSGKATYSTQHASNMLAELEEIALAESSITDSAVTAE